jgi:hypothetical protein
MSIIISLIFTCFLLGFSDHPITRAHQITRSSGFNYPITKLPIYQISQPLCHPDRKPNDRREVRWSGGTPTLCLVPCGIREFSCGQMGNTCSIFNYPITKLRIYQISQTPYLSRCRPESRAPGPAPEQFPCIVLDPIRSCRHTGAGEGSAPLQPRVARKVVNGCSPFLVTTPNSVFPTESRTMRLSGGAVEERPFMAAKGVLQGPRFSAGLWRG